MISLVKLKKLPSMELFDLSKENELDTYMSRQVPVPEGDEAQSITQEEVGQGHEYHCWFNHGSNCTINVFPKETKYVWFLDQAIWREEHKSEDGFEKTSWRMWRSRIQRPCSHKSLSNQEQLEVVKEEVKNAEVVMATLNGLPGSWNSFIQGMCSRRKKKKLVSEDQALIFQRRSLNQWGIWRSQLLKNFLSTLAFG